MLIYFISPCCNLIFFSQDVDILFQTLKSNSFVIGLDLGYNNIGDTGAEILSKLLQV